MKKQVIFLFLAVFILPVQQAWAECRFWAAVAQHVPADVLADGLLEGKNSLLTLSEKNQDGWGIGSYRGSETVVLRGKAPAYQDKKYREAAAAVSSGIIVAHIRQAASGCRHVENPHPFVRRSGGKAWMFGHNGVIDKDVLIALIGKDHLEKDPPETCVDAPPASWVDSELYFMLILKNIDEAKGDVEAGIKKAVRQLEAALGKRRVALNFFLTDGDELWAFRQGHTLFYHWDAQRKYTVVASMHTSGKREDWVEVPEGALVIVRKNTAPQRVDMTR